MISSKIHFSQLTKIFRDDHTGKDITAVDHFNYEMEEGKLVTLLGPSGCGKTTILRMLAGFETPTFGKILVNDEMINDLPPHQRNTAMVFQSYALFPHMNVEQNILYGLKLRNISSTEQKKKISKILEIVGLHGFEKRGPHELSGGQQQRVALGRALIIEPKILLCDEPLSNLDAKLRESMRKEIRRIQKELSITTVYVTHDQLEAMAISDEVIIMNKGRIEQRGIPQEIYFRPRNRFVADFMGAAHFIEGKIKAIQPQQTLIETSYFPLSIPFKAKEKTVGAKVTVVVRPENIRLASSSAQGIDVQVLDRLYLGSGYEYLLELPSGERCLAHFPATAQFEKNSKMKIDYDTTNLHYF